MDCVTEKKAAFYTDQTSTGRIHHQLVPAAGVIQRGWYSVHYTGQAGLAPTGTFHFHSLRCREAHDTLDVPNMT